jgi:hypothetical protein
MDYLLAAVDVAGEAGNNAPSWRGAKHRVDGGTNVGFGCGESGHNGVGRADQQQVDAFVAKPCETRQVGKVLTAAWARVTAT